MALSNISGFPRIGRNRDLKFATEGYWRGQTSADELGATAKAIRVENWKLMQDQGIDLIPSNDFSYYDQVLDTIALVGAVPERYGWDGGQVDLDTYFAMARGRDEVAPLELTKWFDTNYHYLVPELTEDTVFQLAIISVLHQGFGVNAADALAYGVILQAVEIATAVALGVPALVREGVTWSDMRLRAMAASPVRLPERPRSRSREREAERISA